MNRLFKLLQCFTLSASFLAGAPMAFGGSSNWHCEKQLKDGKKRVLKKVKSKRKCKKAGGKWVKHEHDHKHEGNDHDHEHDHDHDHDDHDHEH